MGLYILLSVLIISAGVLIAIVPQLIFGGAGKQYPKNNTGGSPISFCIGAVLLLIVSSLDCWEILVRAGEYISSEDILNCIKLAEALLGCFIAILILCKNYNVFLQFTILVKLVFLIFNNIADMNGIIKNFGLCFVHTLFCLIEIAAWVGIFKFIAIIRDNEIEQNSKLVLVFKATPFLMIPSVFIVQNKLPGIYLPFTSTQRLIINIVISLVEILTIICLSLWFSSPFKKNTEAYQDLYSERKKVKLLSKDNGKFLAIVLSVAVSMSLIWAGLAQIRLPKSDKCPYCDGRGLVRTTTGAYDECEACDGSGHFDESNRK